MDGACTELEDKQFVSTVKFVCNAETSDGTHLVNCPAELDFYAGDEDKSKFFWMPSDYGITGTVRCDGDEITSDDAEHKGTWNPDSDTLVWDGLEYVHVGPAR